MSEQQTINERIGSFFIDDFLNLELKAKTVLLAEGQVPKKLFFIVSGSVRVSFYNNGEQTTFQFAFVDQLFASFESLCSNQPSWYTIQTIKPSIIHCITKEKFQRQMAEKPELKQWFDTYAYKRLFHYQNLFIARIRDKPEKRYQKLM